jgi:ComF family protein
MPLITKRKAMANLARTALDILLPPRCIACGELVFENGSLCGTCWTEIDFITSPLCITCGYPLEADAKKDSLCGHCIQKTPEYDQARSVFCYNEKSRAIIISYKYSDKTHSTERFVEWLMRVGKEMIEETDIIMPVPLHWRRLFERRYNQAALIANILSERSGVEGEMMALRRRKYTKPQASLTRRQRLKNLKGVFVVNDKYVDKIKGNNVLLIDDVATTGATIAECSKVLKKAGAEKVFVLTLARTVEGH